MVSAWKRSAFFFPSTVFRQLIPHLRTVHHFYGLIVINNLYLNFIFNLMKNVFSITFKKVTVVVPNVQ